MNLFSKSNQNGAPRDTASAVKSQPRMCTRSCQAQPLQNPSVQKRRPGNCLPSTSESHPIGSANFFNCSKLRLYWQRASQGFDGRELVALVDAALVCPD